MSYDVLQNGCSNCAIHQRWIREPKLNKQKKDVEFLHSFHWCCGWLVEWLIWCGIHTSIICSSGVLHYRMYHWISWRVTRHKSAWSPSPPETFKMISVLLCVTSGLLRDCGASAVTPGVSSLLKTVAPVDLDTVCSCGGGWCSKQHLQPLASAFTCLGGKF